MSIVYPHQKAVHAELRETADAFFSGDWRGLSIQPRFPRLVVGPSGCGKTHLVQTLARELAVAIFAVGTTNWLPLGCSERGARPTWIDIARFIQNNPRGIIFLDELDKLSHPTPWATFLRVEIFALLDGDVPINLRIPQEDDDEDTDPADYSGRVAAVKAALGENFLVVGGGAFQDLWAAKKGTVGFGATGESCVEALDHRLVASVIPTELANRFAAPILSIPPMVESHYRELLQSALEQLPAHLRHEVAAAAERSLPEAVEHGLGCRWIQQLILAATIRLRRRAAARPQKALGGADTCCEKTI